MWVKQSALYVLSLPQGRHGHLTQPLVEGKALEQTKGATVSDPATFSSSSHFEHQLKIQQGPILGLITFSGKRELEMKR